MRARLQAVFENPLSGDRLRGRIRLLGVVLVIFILGWIGCFHFEDLETQDIIAGWRSHYRLLKLVPIGLMNSLIVFGRGLRYYFLVFMAFAAAFLIGARYIQDIYKLGGFSLAIQYLGALLFAFGYPRLTIEAGEAQIPPSETNLLDAIGGPGYLIINPGSLVLLESVDGAPRICAAGVNFVTRREKIREI
ncbi:MAG: hypothetical protein U9Q82_08660, partial [Chloroflexota bacterium]|nr:hypothetical protein [Chloroflexota bacterium]